MWFARLFGRRHDRSAEEEPQARPAPQPATKAPAIPAKRPQPQLTLQPSQTEAKRKGFDPYNSGSFERHNAWERVGRR